MSRWWLPGLRSVAGWVAAGVLVLGVTVAALLVTAARPSTDRQPFTATLLTCEVWHANMDRAGLTALLTRNPEARDAFTTLSANPPPQCVGA